MVGTVAVVEVVTGVGRTVVNRGGVPGSVGGIVRVVVTFVDEVVTESVTFLVVVVIVVFGSIKVGV